MARLSIIILILAILTASSISVLADDKYILSWINQVLTSLGASFWDPCNSTNPVLAVNNLKPTSLENAEYYIYFAFASCCTQTLQSWTCPDCLVIGSNVRYVSQVENSVLDVMAYFAIDDTRQEIILTYRGSMNVPDLLLDLTFVPIALVNNTDIKVHKGFYTAQQALYPGVLQGLTALIAANPTYKVVLTGHSLGGAEATLTMFLFTYYNVYPNTSFELYTYGEPRGGNLAYATYFNTYVNIPVARVVNRADIVPHLPPSSLGFYHHANEVFTIQGVTRNCSNAYYEDLTCSDSQGPIYSLDDHLFYFNAEAGSCLFESPVNLVLQFIVNLKPYLPTWLVTALQLNFLRLSPAIATILKAFAPSLGK